MIGVVVGWSEPPLGSTVMAITSAESAASGSLTSEAELSVVNVSAGDTNDFGRLVELPSPSC